VPRKIAIPENDLVFLLKSKDERGYSILYNNYSGALFGVINKVVQSGEAAEDLLQDAFLKIWKNIDAYDATKGSLFTWMLNLTRNLAIDKVRSADFRESSLNISLEDNTWQVDNEYQTDVDVDAIGLKKVVEKLRPDYKHLIDLVYYKGYTQSEVSDEFGIPLGTVKTRIKAAITQLRGMVGIILGAFFWLLK
jgi:RNA polymerase sigma-70 factor, ECF subfamily